MNMLKILCLPLVIVALSTGSALAEGKGKGHQKKPKAHHGAQFCPPGLAKKSPACIPPGQAKDKQRSDDDEDNILRDPSLRYRIGDLARDDCEIVPYTRYQSLPAGTYCRTDDRLLRIDPQTRAILTILQLLANN